LRSAAEERDGSVNGWNDMGSRTVSVVKAVWERRGIRKRRGEVEGGMFDRG
jgi:hypothetical protein